MPNYTNVSTLFGLNFDWGSSKDAMCNLTTVATEGFKASLSAVQESSPAMQVAMAVGTIGALAVGGFLVARQCTSLSLFNHHKKQGPPLTLRSAAPQELDTAKEAAQAASKKAEDAAKEEAQKAAQEAEKTAKEEAENNPKKEAEKATTDKVSLEAKNDATAQSRSPATATETPPPDRTTSSKKAAKK